MQLSTRSSSSSAESAPGSQAKPVSDVAWECLQGAQKQLAGMGAYIEHCFTTMHTNKAPWDAVIDAM